MREGYFSRRRQSPGRRRGLDNLVLPNVGTSIDARVLLARKDDLLDEVYVGEAHGPRAGQVREINGVGDAVEVHLEGGERVIYRPQDAVKLYKRVSVEDTGGIRVGDYIDDEGTLSLVTEVIPSFADRNEVTVKIAGKDPRTITKDEPEYKEMRVLRPLSVLA